MTTTLKKVSVWTGIILMAAFVGMSVLPTASSAAIDTGLKKFKSTAQLGESDIKTSIGNIVEVILGFLGIVAILIVLWAGFLWMTATGNEDQVTKAKGILISGLIGLLIIMSAYAITAFVLQDLGSAAGTDFNL